MHRLFYFLKSQWEQIAWTVIWIPLAISAVGTGDIILIGLTLVIGAVSAFVIYTLVDKVQKRKLPIFGGEASGIRRKGLVFTVGHQAETIDYALQGQKPQWAGFLCTEQTLGVVDRLMASQQFPPDHWRREIVDPRDIADVRTKTHALLDWMIRHGLKPEEIALDPTGGMTPMSLAAFSVAQERQIDSQYVRSNYDDQNRPIRGSQELIFLSRYSTPSL